MQKDNIKPTRPELYAKAFYQFMTKSWKQLTIVGIAILIIILFDLSPFGGNIRFYSKWVACGQKPVSSAGGLRGYGRTVKFYEEPATFEPIRLGQPFYFCTPLEAEKAGYSANPSSYDFPHLRSLNQQ